MKRKRTININHRENPIDMASEEVPKALDPRERVRAFLDELTQLSRRYGLVVGGCGCCGSPNLMDLDNEEPGPYSVMVERKTPPVFSLLEWTKNEETLDYRRRQQRENGGYVVGD